MIQEVQTQVKVGFGLEKLWTAMAPKDMTFVIPKIMPNLVKDVQVIEGDGGLGTIFLFNFGPDVTKMKYQKEKLVEFDEAQHKFSLQVVEGGHLNYGFSMYKTSFKLTPTSELETLVDVKVTYETETSEILMPTKTTESSLAYIKCIETYLFKSPS